MQQHLPFTVLKLAKKVTQADDGTLDWVATALTVYGIETFSLLFTSNHNDIVATALTVYGIETLLDMLVQQKQ